MNRNDIDRGIDLTQVFGILFLRWRIIGVTLGAALAIALIFQIAGGYSSSEVQTPDPGLNTYAASATYAVVPTSDAAELSSDEAARLTQALTQTYRHILSTDSVRQALASEHGLDLDAVGIFDDVEISSLAGTPFISISGVTEQATDVLTVVNGYADALTATGAYPSILFGDFRVELVLVEPALTASLILAPVAIAPVSVVLTPFMFGVIGLFIGVLMAMFVEWVDGRANWPAQVIARIGLPSVGSVCEKRHGEIDPEAFRAAKARINGILPRSSRGRSFLVTSARSKDGKTMVVSNLARSLAEDGSAVMIVSADVRSETSIDGTWPGNESRIGLSEFLNDSSIGLDDIIVATPETGISLITRGRTPESVVPRVDSSRMVDLLGGLTERADWVLLDGSAVLESADAARIAPLVDGTLLVIDGRRTTLSSAQSASDMLAGAGADMIGFFHNRIRGNPVARLLRQEIA